MHQQPIVIVPVRFRLRELFDEAGISQSDAARQSGISFATINRLCTNVTRQVHLDVLEQLAKLLKIEPGDLLEREPKGRRK